MITMEDWVTIRNIKSKKPTYGSRRIAQLLGLSRNTVRSALRSDSPPEYKREDKVNPDLQPFHDYIMEGLFVRKLRKSRILEDIKSKGYKGSQSAFYRYCKKLDPKEHRSFTPYSTAPGEQAQFDWSPYSITVGGKLTKVYVFSYIHGFSRFRIYEASLSQNQSSVFEALENSFINSGGVCERIQTDNDTCFVTDASKENFKWNPRWLAFCGHYSVQPTRSLPGHPWSKGKIERPFDYLETHFIEGNEFDDFEDFYYYLKKFEQKVNDRIHSVTRAEPSVMFEKEQGALSALPSSRYVGIKEESRKVSADCLVSFDGCRYSVPHLFAVKEVWVKVSQGYFLEIYSSQNKLIARHKISQEKGKVIINKKHYDNHRIERGSWDRVFETFTGMFPEHRWFADKVKTQKRINPSYHLTRICEMAKYYHKEDMIKAFDLCYQYNLFTANFIRGYLESKPEVRKENIKILNPNGKSKLPEKNITRSLDYYKNIRR